MKVQDLLTELQETEHYKTFKSQNPQAFFSAAFIIFDLESKTEKIQMDFFLPNQNKIASFAPSEKGYAERREHPFSEPKIHEDEIKQMQPQPTNIKIDIKDLEQNCKTIIKENESAIPPTYLIAGIKNIDMRKDIEEELRIFSSCKNKEQRIQDWREGKISLGTLMKDTRDLILPSL
jgi:hypothetical protein